LVTRLGRLKGLDALIDSDLPVAAGLSSSSALVVAAALGLLTVNDVTMERQELMELLAEAERYVGMRGGGMDQAICLGAHEGQAARIDFDPVRLTPVPVPHEWRFVVASSLIPAEKSGRAREIYNRRSEECREALATVTAHFGVSPANYRRLLEGVPVRELVERATHILGSPLDRRFRHVVTEAARVRQAEQALRESDLARFGSLLNESHSSLRDDYEVSARELDELTEIALAAGASGSRLTGAGLGGCTVSVCAAEQVDAVLNRLRSEFYATRTFGGRLEDHLLVVSPSRGASVTRL
jgi:galactokinase